MKIMTGVSRAEMTGLRQHSYGRDEMASLTKDIAMRFLDIGEHVFCKSRVLKRGRSAARTRLAPGGVERLEPRMVLTAGPLITEFVAVNDGSLLDEDTDASD